MKFYKTLGVIFYALFSACVLLVGAAAGYYEKTIKEEFTISKGSNLVINSLIPVTAEYNGVVLKESNVINNVGEQFKVDLKLLGVIPVKTADVKIVDETYVAVLGTPFGIKMYTDGVLVSDISNIETEEGLVCPANEAGIAKGDYIISSVMPRPGTDMEKMAYLLDINKDKYNKKLPKSFLGSEDELPNTDFSIGLVEVSGLVASITGLDTMLKTADVRLIHTEKRLGGRLVTLVIRGSVSAVQAAVEAGAQASSPLGKLHGKAVIANPHGEIMKFFDYEV